MLENTTIPATGADGFIGSNFVMEQPSTVSSVKIVGLDNMLTHNDVLRKP